MKRNPIAIVTAVALSLPTLAQAEIFNGRLVDHQQRPVADAKIEIEENGQTLSSNADGVFQLDLTPGQYTLNIDLGADGQYRYQIDVDGTAEPQVLHVDLEHNNKVVVLANPLKHTRLDMAAPALVMSGDELTMKRAASLGEMLASKPGVSMSSFGPAVARPVIRGLSGGRVLIANNQMTVQDVSVTSADHDVSLEPLLAEQIEVLKGPATLLYGSGAIGGVVNVTDRRFNPDGAERISGGLEMRLGDGATGERSWVATLNGGNDAIAWHFDWSDSERDDIEIPSGGESKYLLLAEGEPLQTDPTVLENSASDNQSGTLGVTFITDFGHVGVAYNALDKLYGVPGHAEHEETIPAVTEEEAGIAIDLQQERIDLQAEANFEGLFRTWFVGFSDTDYQHVELEGDEVGTRFDNQAQELRSYLRHQPMAGWDGIWGLQLTSRDFSALGEEAFVPPATIDGQALFVVEEKEFADYKLELGARFEQQRMQVRGFSEQTDSVSSLSAGLVWSLKDSDKLAFNLARAGRIPTVEERYSFGQHAATQTFEVGTPGLKEEYATNLDISYRFGSEGLRGEVNIYFNQFDDFIFGNLETNTGTIVDRNGQTVAIDADLPLVVYRQQDANMRGIELELIQPLLSKNGWSLDAALLADYIDAELDNGGNIPRIPAHKYGLKLMLDNDPLSLDISWIRHARQSELAAGELPTDGFDLLDMELAYRFFGEQSESLIFLRGSNLLDEEARDHSSFLKDLAPRVGRNFVVGWRLQF